MMSNSLTLLWPLTVSLSLWCWLNVHFIIMITISCCFPYTASQLLDETTPAPLSQPSCEFQDVLYGVGSLVRKYDICRECVCQVPVLGGQPKIVCPVAKVCQNRIDECPTGASTMWLICKCPYCYKDPFIIHTYTTSPTYYYQYHPVALATNRIVVHIEATNDAYLAFSAEPRDLPKMYEIVLGGWQNKYSVLRRCKQCRVLAWAPTNGILPNKVDQSFWIRFDDGVVAIGLTGFPSLFQYHDPDPLPVRYVGFATRLGSAGTFRFIDMDAIEHITVNFEPSGDFTGCSPVVTVDEKSSPTVMPGPVPSNFVFLYISSNADVVVSLSNDKDPSGSETYRILIGHGTGVRSSIVYCSEEDQRCVEVFSAETFNLLGQDRMYGFWLDAGQTAEGAITFGREGHPAFLSFRPEINLLREGFHVSISVHHTGLANVIIC